jgi:uncharacterized protein YjbI with pentapeptide repeats
MDQCILHRASCLGTRFGGANLTYADFSNADVSGSDFLRATLTRARFHRTKEERAIFGSRAAALGNDELLAEAEAWTPKY